MKDKVKIIVVDDEVELCELIALQLESEEGYQVFTAFNGNDAFKIIQEEKVDAIISDIQMPNGDGIELLKKVKSTPAPHPPVILISGYSKVTEAEALEMGAAAKISKPMRYSEISEALHNALNKPKMQRISS